MLNLTKYLERIEHADDNELRRRLADIRDEKQPSVFVTLGAHDRAAELFNHLVTEPEGWRNEARRWLLAWMDGHIEWASRKDW